MSRSIKLSTLHARFLSILPTIRNVARFMFAAWRQTLSHRNRRIVDALAAGERTKDVAKKFKVTPGRISQLRREFYESWLRFTQDLFGPDDDTAPALA